MTTQFKVTDGNFAGSDLDDILLRREYISEATLRTWGNNLTGQLGDGTTTARGSPGSTVGSGITWKQISCGYQISSGIKTDGTLWTWGDNTYGQLGDSTTVGKSSPITTAGGGSTWKQVSCGKFHIAAVKSDGSLWTWGGNFNGELGGGAVGSRSSPATVAGGGFNWKQVFAIGTNTSAVKTDGTLWNWGYGGSGFLGNGATADQSSPVTTAGGGTTWIQTSAFAAIKSDGTLWTWGYNATGLLGDGTTTDRSSPVTTSGGGTNWKQVSSSGYHTLGIKTDGTLWAWGDGAGGKVGDNTTSVRSSPVTTAGGGTNWKQVSAGVNFSLGIKADGILWSWGNDTYGQMGITTVLGVGGNFSPGTSSPITAVGGGTNWKQVSCGQHNTRTHAAGIIDLSF